MRTLGVPSASTVATAMALGSAASLAACFLEPDGKQPQRLVGRHRKSPVVNHLWCSIETVSDIRGVLTWQARYQLRPGVWYIEERPRPAYGAAG